MSRSALRLRDLPQYEILKKNSELNAQFRALRERTKAAGIEEGMGHRDAAHKGLRAALDKFFPGWEARLDAAEEDYSNIKPKKVPENEDEAPIESIEDRLLGKECKMRESVEWVFNHLGTSLEQAALDAPSMGSLSLLEWATSAQGRTEFYKTFASKLLPTRSQLEIEENFSDKGENIAQDSIRKIFGPDALLRLATEDASEEPGVAV